MRNIVLLIEYDGTNYYGWQRQPGRPTIQETIENTIEKITQEHITLIASGRTDRGVHARGQVANFTIKRDLDLKALYRGLNALLPADIRVKKLYEADPSFHARFSAKKKVYYYYFSHISFYTPILRNYVWYIPFGFDVSKMTSFAKIFLGTHDFSSFRNLRGKWEKGTQSIRTIFSSDILKTKRGTYIYRVCGDGFFYKMVRNMFSIILKVGTGELDEQKAQEIFLSGKRDLAPPPAPSQGLHLIRVIY